MISAVFLLSINSKIILLYNFRKLYVLKSFFFIPDDSDWMTAAYILSVIAVTSLVHRRSIESQCATKT